MSSPSPSETLDARAWKIIAVVIIAPFMTQMDSTIVNVSLSTIGHDLHSPIETAQWVISAYLLALALMLPLSGVMVDRYGAKKLYLGCFTAFTAASLLCGFAHTMPQLIAGRVLQGLAGGLLTPLTQLMIVRVAGKQVARVIGYGAVPVLLAPLLGPILAGTILKYADWSWLFYVNLPVGILGVVLAARIIPSDDIAVVKRRFDIPGFLLISPGLASLLYGFEQVSHHRGPGFLILGIVFLAVFVWRTIRTKSNALIDLELFKNHTFSVATITQFLGNGILYAGQFLIPLYLTVGCGFAATKAGWILSAMGVGMLCVYPFMGNLTDKFGCRAVATTGVALNFFGTLPFLWMAYDQFSMPLALIGLFARGIGQGATGIPSMAAAYAAVPKEKLSFATTTLNIVQRLGGPMLTTILASVVSIYGVAGTDSSHQLVYPFVVLIAFQLLILASAIRLPVRIHQEIKKA